MYLHNKYTKWYYSIIKKSQTRVSFDFDTFEKHHIIPRSLGGANQKNNIALLTAKEHFICHLLLPKMTEGMHKAKMYHALSMMMAKPQHYNRTYKITSTVYELVRKRISENLKNLWAEPGRKDERSKRYSGSGNPFYGKKHSQESIEKIKNKEISDETRRKMSMAQKKRFENIPGTFNGKTHTEETKIRISKRRKELFDKTV